MGSTRKRRLSWKLRGAFISQVCGAWARILQHTEDCLLMRSFSTCVAATFPQLPTFGTVQLGSTVSQDTYTLAHPRNAR